MLLTYFPFAGQCNFLLTDFFQISVFIVFSMLFYYIKSYQKSHLQALSIYLMIFARTDSRALYRHEKLKLICCLLPVQRSFKKSLSIILLAISKKPPRKYLNFYIRWLKMESHFPIEYFGAISFYSFEIHPCLFFLSN